MERRQLVTSAAYSVAAAALPLGAAEELTERIGTARRRGVAGAAEIDAVRNMTSLFVTLDERHGGQHGRSAVVQYLRSDVVDLCRARFATEEKHHEALAVAACLAYLCGWKAYDAHEHGLAQHYYLQAYALTREAADEVHGAWILRILAHNGMDVRRPEHTLDLAEAALARVRGRLAPPAEALFAVTRARALAVAGRGPEAVRQLRAAQDLVLRGEPDELPYWAALWGPPRGTLASHTAKTFHTLGDHANAERHYALSSRYRPGSTHRRIAALSLISQGREQSALGRLEAACDTWGRSLDLLEGVRSARAVDAVAGIRRQLGVFRHRGVQTAADLDERARNWLGTHRPPRHI
ncbi:tetratricopeptide repeat protein [Streptomyces carminius]|nr:hypothetical protein [Streptomyces carminius]